MVSPSFRASPAEPAAEREPGDAGRRVDPERGREPEGLRLAVELAERHAGARRARSRATGSTRTDRIGDRSIMSPPSHTALPAMLCPPPRIDRRRPCSRAKSTACDHVRRAARRARPRRGAGRSSRSRACAPARTRGRRGGTAHPAASRGVETASPPSAAPPQRSSPSSSPCPDLRPRGGPKPSRSPREDGRIPAGVTSTTARDGRKRMLSMPSAPDDERSEQSSVA